MECTDLHSQEPWDAYILYLQVSHSLCLCLWLVVGIPRMLFYNLNVM